MEVIEAIRGRASTRAFLDQPVDKEVIQEILDVARWSPSGANTQPWQVAVVTGEAKRKLGDAMVEACVERREVNSDYNYYADRFPEVYRERQVACGYALYSALGIERSDREARMEQWLRNFHGFGAPTELLFFLDSVLAKGSWIDIGLFLQSVMLAARSYGLETCPQASFADYPDIVREHLGYPESTLVVCGVAIGYPDPSDPVNNYRTERDPVEGFTRWLD